MTLANGVSRITNSDQDCENFEDTDTYFLTVEELITSERKRHSYSSNATVSKCVPIDTDASPPGSNTTKLVAQLGTSKGQYFKLVFQ